MEPLPIIRAIHRSRDSTQTLATLCQAFPAGAVRLALWLGETGEVRQGWPEPAEVSPDLVSTALHLRQPEILHIGGEFPVDQARHPDSDVLVLPLRTHLERRGTCLLLGRRELFQDDPDGWEAVAEALLVMGDRHADLARLEEKLRAVQQRAEESEALHTLGLAANRTLHTDEVLRLVARFTRSLLGADYVTVSTTEDTRIRTVASVGLRDPNAAGEDYWLARKVVEAGKPVVVGSQDGVAPVSDFPFHAEEGMRVGLGIPLSLFGDTFGALIVGHRAEVGITPRDIRFALTLAGHAAVAISNARFHQTVTDHAEKLNAAYEELHQLSQAKERFFASINHELRNPIGAILGYLQLALDGTGGEVPAPARSFLGKADRNARTLLALVNDILDLSKIAAGKMEVEPRACSVAELVEGTLTTMQPLAQQRGVPLDVGRLEPLPELYTDPQRVQQILVNLLSNAIKFTGPGGVRLSAAVRDANGDGAWLDLRISDTGPGLSREDQASIFEEFEQVKGTKGGTGLGLPISRRFARLLGGDLLVESEPGAGATFILRLPVAGDGAARGPDPASPAG